MSKQVIIFDIEGTMGHFRKFYTNSSSLSYSFPPRTVITGIIAGILGYERDSYYEEFCIKKCRIALAIRNPVRKLIQTVNYIRTKDIREVTGSGGHTQIPIEFVLSSDGNGLRYRVYFSHNEDIISDEFLKQIKSGNFEYPVYLGITECPGRVVYIDVCEASKIEGNKDFEISSVVSIEKIKIPKLSEGFRYMKEDRVPVEFDSQRMLSKVGKYLYEQNCKKIKITVKEGFLEDVLRLCYKEGNKDVIEDIIFMD